MSQSTAASHIPALPTSAVRERWLGLLELTYATRRVTQAVIEPGVSAVVAPGGCLETARERALEEELRAAFRQVAEMARGFRLNLNKTRQYGLPLDDDCDRWLGRFAPDIASGKTSVVVFVDLAYLEAALIDHLYQTEVLVDFKVPLAYFHRAGLVDCANVLEAAAVMVFEGRSLRDAGGRLARETLAHLEAYAAAFWKLSRLFSHAGWRIEDDNFFMEVPGKDAPLALHYWDLRGDDGRMFQAWLNRIEGFVRRDEPLEGASPKSFAA
jgi:hypothetical protein